MMGSKSGMNERMDGNYALVPYALKDDCAMPLCLNRTLSVLHDFRHMRQCPFGHGFNNGNKRFCSFRELILHPWRHFRINLAGDQTISLKRTECGSEHFLRYVGYGLMNGIEAQTTIAMKGIDDKQRPLAANMCQDITDRAILEYRFGYWNVHKFFVFNNCIQK